MKNNALIIHPRDNVAVALTAMTVGDTITANGIEVFKTMDEIPVSHKIALRNISIGEEIIKYGEVVAVSMQMIKKGQWVHTHNLEGKRWKK
jgi:altronate dehydratase